MKCPTSRWRGALGIQLGAGEYDENGKPLRLVGTVTDITEKKQARACVEESLSLYKATLESTADGILVVDLQGPGW